MKKIKNNLILMFLILVSIPLITQGSFNYLRSKEVLTKGLESTSMSTTKETRNGILTYLDIYKQSASYISKSNNLINYNKDSKESLDELLAEFEQYQKSFEDVDYIYIGFPDKDTKIYPYLDLNSNGAYDPTTRPWYKNAIAKNGVVCSDPYFDERSKTHVITYSAPIKKNNELVGVLAIDISLKRLSQKIGDIIIGNAGHAFLLDSNNKIMAHEYLDQIGQTMNNETLINALNSGKKEGLTRSIYQGKSYVYSYAKLENCNWTVVGSINIDEIKSHTNYMLYNTLIFTIISIIIASIASILYSKKLSEPINKLVNATNKASSGDLNAHVEINAKNEIGVLANSFNLMLDNMNSLISNTKSTIDIIDDSAKNLATATDVASTTAQEVSNTVTEIANGASSQAEESEKCVTLVNDLDSQFNNLVDNSTTMMDAAKSIMNKNIEGNKSIDVLKNKSDESEKSIERIENAVLSLKEKVLDIGNILATITSISEQTSLLALNASIEAARAGEHGSGFAVVAEEIRKLSIQSNSSTDEIYNIVKNIQDETNMTVNIMNDVKESSLEQNNAVNTVSTSFKDISFSIDEIYCNIELINEFVSDMNNSKDNILSSIENISAVSEETAASTEEVTASSEEQTASILELSTSARDLEVLAKRLKDEIKKFNI